MLWPKLSLNVKELLATCRGRTYIRFSPKAHLAILAGLIPERFPFRQSS